MTDGSRPRVRVVVVNFNGGESTRRCVESILATEWPRDALDVVLVDNASADGVASGVAREHPRVRVVANRANLGFAGGCNAGMRDRGDADYVALLNPDTQVEPGWLAPLVAVLERDPHLGAVCPKIVLAAPYHELVLAVPGPGSRRRGQVRVDGVRVDGRDVDAQVRFGEGFSGPDGPTGAPGRWVTGGRPARLLVPGETGATPRTVELRLRGCTSTRVTVGGDGGGREITVTDAAQWHPLTVDSAPRRLVNSAGTALTHDGFGLDVGYLEPDDGRYDLPGTPWGWSGAGVLLRREYLDATGPFDERLFLYYEDLELAWRGRDGGWSYAYEPSSVVRHEHARSTGADSSFARHFIERNRLLVLLRHATPALVVGAVFRYLRVTAAYAARELAARSSADCTPEVGRLQPRLRVFAGFVRRAPGMLAARRSDRRS